MTQAEKTELARKREERARKLFYKDRLSVSVIAERLGLAHKTVQIMVYGDKGKVPEQRP